MKKIEDQEDLLGKKVLLRLDFKCAFAGRCN
jgi:hypothetical protein